MESMGHYFKAVGSLIRPLNSIHPLLLVYIGGIIVQAPGPMLVGALVVYFILHSAVTLSNDLDDIAVDAANGRDTSAAELVKETGGQWLVAILYGGSIIASILYFPVLFTVLLVVGLVCAWTYNQKPLQLSRRPLGSTIVLGLCYGLLPFLSGAAINSPLTVELLILGLGLALSRVSLSILKDYKDAVGDAKHHKKTFLLVFGRTIVRRTSVVLALIGYVVTIGNLVLFMPQSANSWLWTITAAVVALWLIYERTKLSPSKSYGQLNLQFHRLLSYELLFYGAIILWVSTSLA